MSSNCSFYSKAISDALFEELKIYIAPASMRIFKTKMDRKLTGLLAEVAQEKTEIAEAMTSGKFITCQGKFSQGKGRSKVDLPLFAPRSEDDDCDDSHHDPSLTKEELDRDLDDFLELRDMRVKMVGITDTKELGISPIKRTSRTPMKSYFSRKEVSPIRRKSLSPVKISPSPLQHTPRKYASLLVEGHITPPIRRNKLSPSSQPTSPVSSQDRLYSELEISTLGPSLEDIVNKAII